MNKTYKEMVDYAYSQMDYLSEEIGIAKCEGRYVDAENLYDEWEEWYYRKEEALRNWKLSEKNL